MTNAASTSPETARSSEICGASEEVPPAPRSHNLHTSASRAPLKPLRLALIGAPNCGKSALFNALTGHHQKVANYAGVTVECFEGSFTLPDGDPIDVMDLPGMLSLRARSPDEVVSRDVILGCHPERTPQAAVLVANATHLLPALKLALEVKPTGLPMILAVNMMDIAQANGRTIDLARLEKLLGMPVVPTVAVRRHGTDALCHALAQRLAEWQSRQPACVVWHPPSLKDVRALHREATRLMDKVVTVPGQPLKVTHAVDRVLLHPVMGPLILLAVLFTMFQAVFAWATPAMDGLESLVEILANLARSTIPEGYLQSLVIDGVLAGVGGVIVFLPQIMILFAWIVVLEDSGYMARAAFMLDRLMGGVGLHGRAFIPLLSSFACAIPGIMATRTINQPRDRLTTILIAPLMTCSARLPVYTLIIAALVPPTTLAGFVNSQGLVMFALYALGIVGALLVAFILKKLVFRTLSEPLMLEMPSYKRPSFRAILRTVLYRAALFIRRAGTVIFALSIVLWLCATFPEAPADATLPAISYSLIGQLGALLEPLMRPLGFSWQMTVSLLPAMAAREVAVSALATIYAVGDSAGALDAVLQQTWTLPAALAFLVWFVFAPQCISTLAVVRRETGGWRWALIMFAYMTVLAWLAAWATFRVSGWVLTLGR